MKEIEIKIEKEKEIVIKKEKETEKIQIGTEMNGMTGKENKILEEEMNQKKKNTLV